MIASSRRRSRWSWLSLSAVAAALLPVAGSPLQPRTTHALGPVAIVDPALTAAMAAATAPLGVVVTFNKTTAPGLLDLAVLSQVGITRGVAFSALPMAGVLATPAQISALARKPGIRSLYLNAPLTFYNAEARELTGVNSVQSSSAMTAQNGGLPVAGHGVTVLINDSGVDGLHADLQYGTHLIENTLGTTNLHALSALLPVTYLEGIPSTDTNSGHGTHCAGSVGGSGARSGGLYAGVAPAADLVGYGSGAALLVLDALGGFDYALSRKDELGIDVISNSWGSSGDFDPEDPVNLASYLATKNNITVVFAAGNEGPAEDTHNPYAKAPWVISVAAGTKQGELADFSSRGTPGVGGSFVLDNRTWTWEDRPTVTAPGVSIISTRAVGPVSSLAVQQDLEALDPLHLPFYTHMDGTSMATPHVAGIVALLLDANPALTPADVKQILQSTATPMPGHEPWEVGAGYVDAYAAVDEALSSAP